MKRKPVLLTAFIGLMLLAVYEIWHYNPLKLLTPLESQPRQPEVTAFGTRNHPVIVKKKISRRPQAAVQQSNVPQPLTVLKDEIAKNTSDSVEQNKAAANNAIEKEKAPALQPDDRLSAKETAPEIVPPAAVSKTIESQAQPISAEPKSHLPYSILLSSCRLPQSARRVVSDLQKTGLAPYVVKVKFENGDVWLRVLAGHYATRNEALKVKKTHHLSDAIVKKTPYANLVGSFSSEDAVKESLKRLKGLGYSPYVLKRAENRLQVMVGAFITREGAEEQQSELQSKGVSNEIIER